MSRRKFPPCQQGFTLIELMVTMVIVGIVSTVFFTSFNTSISQYLKLQEDSSRFSELAASSQRIANVLRGTTDFISVDNNDVTVYAYFYPNNSYVSQIRYYLNNTQTRLLADVTPMSANPPYGTPLTAQKKTYTIMENFYKAPGVNLFTYLDASGNSLTLPVSDQNIIKGIDVVLSEPGASSSARQTITLNVSLRNRKTNL